MSINVLVVDDSAVMRSMVIKTLKMAGSSEIGEIFQAANGQEGLEVLEDNWVDLIIADINMPVMNGLEMIDNIQADNDWERLPIVVISTEGSQTRIDELNEKGIEFIHKPFTPEAIRNVLVNKLGIKNV